MKQFEVLHTHDSGIWLRIHQKPHYIEFSRPKPTRRYFEIRSMEKSRRKRKTKHTYTRHNIGGMAYGWRDKLSDVDIELLLIECILCLCVCRALFIPNWFFLSFHPVLPRFCCVYLLLFSLTKKIFGDAVLASLIATATLLFLSFSHFVLEVDFSLVFLYPFFLFFL